MSSDSVFQFLARGALLQEFSVAGHNLVLNFSTDDAYRQHNAFYFSETIGRCANRIEAATIKRLNGRSYKLQANNGPNALHGGLAGWGKKLWQGPSPESIDGHEAVVFTYRSPHGEEGYPGTVDAKVTYSTSSHLEDGVEKTVLDISYEVLMADDQPEDVQETVVNLTNHSYFNLGDQSTIDGTEARLYTQMYLPLTPDGIPKTGPTRHPHVAAAEAILLGKEEPVFDDCFVLNPDPSSVPLDSRSAPLRLAASFAHPATGLNLEVLTTEPAFQFYTGDYVDVPAVDTTPARPRRAGFCVEPGRYINAVNVDDWRSMVVLKKGQVYGSRVQYKAWHSGPK